MTQIKEKTGICKSVLIATVVTIRDVVKCGFHCISSYEIKTLHKQWLSLAYDTCQLQVAKQK